MVVMARMVATIRSRFCKCKTHVTNMVFGEHRPLFCLNRKSIVESPQPISQKFLSSSTNINDVVWLCLIRGSGLDVPPSEMWQYVGGVCAARQPHCHDLPAYLGSFRNRYGMRWKEKKHGYVIDSYGNIQHIASGPFPQIWGTPWWWDALSSLWFVRYYGCLLSWNSQHLPCYNTTPTLNICVRSLTSTEHLG